MAEPLNMLIPALGYALLHFLWQGALIGLLAASALIALRRSRPQARYALACVAMGACVLAPIATIVTLFGGDPANTLASPQTSAHGLLAAGVQAALDRIGGLHRIDANLPWIVALWAVGACLLSLRIVTGIAWIGRQRATPQATAQAVWQARLDAIAAQFRLPRGVSLRLVDTLDTPASAGWLRPVVLLPTALITRMPVELIDALLAHELAHVRRHDYLVNLMQSIVESLLFYHPVIWWLSRQIRDERELIADQLAATATASPRHLALALSELAELRHAQPLGFGLVQTAVGGRLMQRIQRLIRPDTAVGSGRMSLAFVSLAAACIAVHAQSQLALRGEADISALKPRATAAQQSPENIIVVRDDAPVSLPDPRVAESANEAHWNAQMADLETQYRRDIEHVQHEWQQLLERAQSEAKAGTRANVDAEAQAEVVAVRLAEMDATMQRADNIAETYSVRAEALAVAAEDAATAASEAAEAATTSDADPN